MDLPLTAHRCRSLPYAVVVASRVVTVHLDAATTLTLTLSMSARWTTSSAVAPTRLQRLGFPSHILAFSRGWGMTFKDVRQRRRDYARSFIKQPETYVIIGWRIPPPGVPAHETSQGLNRLNLYVFCRQVQMSHAHLLSGVECDTARPRFADGATAKRAATAANRAGSGGRRPTLLIWYGKSSQKRLLAFPIGARTVWYVGIPAHPPQGVAKCVCLLIPTRSPS